MNTQEDRELDEVLSPAEVARALGTTIERVIELIACGEIEPCVARRELDAFTVTVRRDYSRVGEWRNT